MKKYNRTLLVALLIVAVFATAIGGTFAWFTDNVEVTGNVIKSGTLDMKVYTTDGDGNAVALEDGSAPLFDYKLWEPGYVAYKPLTIKNEGNLAFKYQLNVKSSVTDDQTSQFNLADVIDVYVLDGNTQVKRDTVAATAPIGTITDLSNGTIASAYTGVLLPAEGVGSTDVNVDEPATTPRGEITVNVVLKMQESAGNEFQNLSIGDGFALELIATQYTWENDSFDHNYDADSKFDTDTSDNEEEPDVELPDATVERLPEDELLVELSTLIAGTVGYPHKSMIDETVVTDDGNSIDKMKMDYGLTFIANETMEDLVGKPYENWNADFEVSVSKPITEADYTDEDEAPLVLLGNFDPWGWCPVPANLEIEADVPVRLLDSVIGEYPYSDVLTLVKTFHCGIKADRDWAVPGTSVTVKLMMYEVVDGEETENKYVVCEDTYTYQ